MIFVPHQYQRDAIEFLKQHKCAALFADPGLGKTGILLSLIAELYFSEQTLCPALVIAPKRVTQVVWPGEIQKFWRSFGYLSYQILHGPDKEQRLIEPSDLYILNVENIFWALGKREFKTLIIDESSKFKSFSSKRFKALAKHLADFEHRYILTGTPAPNSVMDLFTQQCIVDLGQAFGRRITHFRNRYFNAFHHKNFTEWSPKRGAANAIQQRIAPTTLRLDRCDHLDLPDIIYNDIHVKLPPKALALYKELETKFFAKLGEQTILLSTSGQLYGLCCQLANGRMYKPKGLDYEATKEVLEIHSAKIEAIRDLIDELQGKPVLIAYHYKHDLAQLQNAFGNPPYVGSGDDDKLIRAWNRKKIPILLGHPMSMAHGLNMQSGGHDIVWMAPPDNLENYLQFNQRIWRQGVQDQVRVHHIVADDTIDLAKLRRLHKKDQTQMSLLDAIKEYRNGNK